MTDSAVAAPIEGPALVGSVPALTLPQFIRLQARRWPGALALADAGGEHALTYGGLDQRIGRCAAGLAAAGLRPGDTLVMCSANGPSWVVVALAAMAAGARVGAANPSCTAAALAHRLCATGAGIVFTQPELLSTVRQAAAAASCRSIVVDGQAPGTLSLAGLLACTAAAPALPQEPHAPALLAYSAGSAGTPRGAILSHRALVANICQLRQAASWGTDTVVLSLLPMFGAMGFVLATLTALACGARVVTLPRFEPQSFLQALATHRVTDAIVVPPVVQFLASHPGVDGHDLGALRLLVSGGAALPAAVQARAARRLDCACTQVYGLTEASACVAAGLSAPDLRPGSVGRLLPGTQCRVVDPASGSDLPRGQPAELWFRGPQRFDGYLRQAQAAEPVLARDGWIRSGDIGQVDAEGFVFVSGRLDDLIRLNGQRVAPAGLEALLLAHPRVADAAVIGRADRRAGQRPVAYVVARGAVDVAALRTWADDRLPPHERLADVVLLDALPRAPSGKLMRRLLRERDAARHRSA